MKKKLLAVLMAAAVFTMGSMTALAASPTVATTEAPVSTQKASTVVEATMTPKAYLNNTSASYGFSLSEVSATTVKAAAVAVQNAILNNVAAIAQKLGNSTLLQAAGDSGKQVRASILTLVEVKTSGATKDATGNYVVTLNVANVVQGDNVVILHYTGNSWETIAPRGVANGSVTFASASLSPFAVVKLNVVGVSQSPKTGSSIPMAGVALVISVVGMTVCGKKYLAHSF
ncbi:MAG: hypothetical protein OSJ73_14505 [Lachnospiraceae bacterium]|nr:hypothetical protein [Lachnospiraceae bacterium]